MLTKCWIRMIAIAGLITTPFAWTLAGCGSGDSQVDVFEPLDFETFVDGKEDTGYLSNKAAELEAKLTSSVYLDMTGQGAAAIQAKADSLRNASRWTLQSHTSPQLKYARNPLKNQKLDMNLESGEPTLLGVRTDANGVWIDFDTAIESLVKFKDLEQQNLTPADLVGKRVEFMAPATPETVFAKGGLACANDPDGDALNAEDLRADNYFYYFDPAKAGCPLQPGRDLVTAQYVITSSLDTTSVYPEYDLLTQDKKITMVALFGQIEHGDLASNDLGWVAYKEFRADMKRAGFAQVRQFDNNHGEQLRKVYPGGLEVVVDFYTPEALRDHRPREEVNALFKTAIRDNEIVYYNGHAFYGSLTVLDQRDAYPVDTYQVIFMDACWSYAYYTKQVFANKSSEADLDGMKYADVVNNTEPGITGSHKTAWLLYKNMFQAASDLMQSKPLTKYSWNNLIVYMNDSADQRARYYDPAEFHAEIYGVSGVTSNCFNPAGPSFCKLDEGSSRTHTYDDAVETSIPDNNPTGINRTIQVPDSFDLESVQVQIDLKHTYIGDLKVVLSHGGVEQVLHDQTGGGADDIRTTWSAAGLAGAQANGAWTLTVSDRATYDTGKLLSWRLILTEPGGSQGTIGGENAQSRSIPDNNPAGISSVISIADAGTAGEVQVRVKVTHTYIGDLVIRLEHAGLGVDLQRQEGGSTANLDKSYTTAAFAGQSVSGEWTLKVSDLAAADSGTLDFWSLTIYP